VSIREASALTLGHRPIAFVSDLGYLGEELCGAGLAPAVLAHQESPLAISFASQGQVEITLAASDLAERPCA